MSEPEVSVYSAKNVNVNYGGHNIRGFGSGEDAIKVQRLTPGVSMVVGIQGDGTYSQSTDRSARITLRLLAGSSSNEFLDLKANANDAGLVFSEPLIITEVGSKGKVTALKCIIEKVPDWKRGSKAGEVEWTFLSINCSISHSGPDRI